jgi:kinetochore protein Spc7/SPC105
VPIKSILKPTLPLSPPRLVPGSPSRSGAQRNSAGTATSFRVQESVSASSGLFVAIPNGAAGYEASAPVSGLESLQNPFGPGSIIPPPPSSSLVDAKTVPVQAAASLLSDAERQLREKEKQEILERREARRKSLGAPSLLFISPTDYLFFSTYTSFFFKKKRETNTGIFDLLYVKY